MNRKEVLIARGLMAFRQQIEDAGGVYTTQQVTELLGITPGDVRKRLERGRLLAVSMGEGTSYPVWQFDDKGVIERFADIMAMISTTSPVGMVQFFLTHDEDMGKTPVEALKGGDPKQLKMVKILAQQFNQQVAR
ncbi:MAG: hypothetical protein RPU34_05705 [Candidatus Sedimenticola sp. (ex Thyasira tokunagai)]